MTTNGLSRATIVAEALALLNEAGLDEVSLRKVASRLGVKAPSLYWHVEDKAALYALMSETVFRACLDAVPPCADWQGWLRSFGRALWEAQRRVRDSARLIMLAGLPDVRLRALADEIAAELGRFGIDGATAAAMQSSVQALITGWIGFDQGPSSAFLNGLIPIEESVMQSLDALVDGWSAHLTDALAASRELPVVDARAKG